MKKKKTNNRDFLSSFLFFPPSPSILSALSWVRSHHRDLFLFVVIDDYNARLEGT